MRHVTTNSETAGPELLDERSLGGIFVHFFGLITGVIGPAIVYAISDHEFTRANARHAINWYTTLILLFVGGAVPFFLGAEDVTVGGDPVDWAPLAPAPLDTVFAVLGFGFLAAFIIAGFLTFIYVIVATTKAIFGSVWTYPGAVDVISRLQ